MCVNGQGEPSRRHRGVSRVIKIPVFVCETKQEKCVRSGDEGEGEERDNSVSGQQGLVSITRRFGSLVHSSVHQIGPFVLSLVHSLAGSIGGVR